ncbi:hypothetical protein FHL15_009307 [Xylaria flabelliformis]|uniref:BHLH domain-containing protein n=1 Tax=Xylaria flabelliformis TaxID=2512241 RepID=A0A553HPI8_9PEZI|nr:hypothetical protein FHL15_009307 [Xylaria flabelliformis]
MSRNGKGSEGSFYNGHVAVSQTPRFTNRYGPETLLLPPFGLPALPITDLTDPSNDDLGWLGSLPDSTQASTMPPLDRWDRPASTLTWCPPLTGSAIESGTSLVKNKRQGKALGDKAAMKPKGRKPGHSESYRGHYAVEQKYRSRLNEQFAALSQAIWRPETQRICRTETGLLSPPSSVSQASQDQDGRDSGPKRQNKIDVLSNAIDTIQFLTERCDQKRQELDQWGEQLGSIGEMIRGIAADAVDDDQSVEQSLAQMSTGSSTTMMIHEPNGLEMRRLGLM